MKAEYEIIIADTTCFILLDKIGELDILRLLFGRITTTHVIAAEFGRSLPEWVDIKTIQSLNFEAVAFDLDA